MTRLIFVDEDLVMMFEADLPAAELVQAVQNQRWQIPPALLGVLGPRQPASLRAVRVGRLVIVSPMTPRTGPLPLNSLPPGLELSERQLQVLQGLADNLTSKEIATQLGLHIRSVELHISAIKRRFGTTSRMQSVMRGVALGLCKVRPEPK